MSTVSNAPDLAPGFTGELLQPTDPGYDVARRIHNGLVDKRPALIARCQGVADVADAVKMARTDESEAGLESDVDAAYTAATEGVGEDDFEIVTDFYTQRPATAARRSGGASLVDQLTAAKGQDSGTSLAENVIANAMARAGEASGKEKAQCSGSTIQA